jgi:hypothetical protein
VSTAAARITHLLDPGFVLGTIANPRLIGLSRPVGLTGFEPATSRLTRVS